MNEARAQENASTSWPVHRPDGRSLERSDRLSRSSTREVAEAVRQLKPAYDMYDQAAATQKRNKELISKIGPRKGPGDCSRPGNGPNGSTFSAGLT